LIEWTGSQHLESLASIGLLPFARAQLRDNEVIRAYLPPLETALRAHSLLSELLLQALSPDKTSITRGTAKHSGEAEAGFAPNPFFEKYATAFLPPIYMTRGTQIERRSGVPFVRQWGYEWEALIATLGLEPSLRSMDTWWGRKHEGRQYAAVDTLMSEVYRSAYLRAIAWTLSVGGLRLDDARFLAAQTCPIDLGLWRLRPAHRPSWWPDPVEESSTVDTFPSTFWPHLESLWATQLGASAPWGSRWVLAEAGGFVQEGDQVFDIDIQGVFQKCHGPTTPDFAEVYKWYRYENRISPDVRSVLSFAGSVGPDRVSNAVRTFADWSLVPATASASPIAVPRWQFWRMYRSI
jgi:hypothetical protein